MQDGTFAKIVNSSCVFGKFLNTPLEYTVSLELKCEFGIDLLLIILEHGLIYSLKNLVSQKTCFRNPENPSCIDLILINCSRSFQNTDVFETGLSDFHKLIFIILKQYYPKQKPKVVFYRRYKNFRNDLFRSELENQLSNYNINNMEYDVF